MKNIIEKAQKIKLVIFDVDGVLTDGSVWYGDNGVELKPFNIKDGLGIKLLHRGGIETGIITGRNSPVVERRATELGFQWILQGREQKIPALEEIAQQAGVNLEEIAYMGDDLPDLPIIKRVGLGMTVADGHHSVVDSAHWQSIHNGGAGAAREAAEFILSAQQKLDGLLDPYLQ